MTVSPDGINDTTPAGPSLPSRPPGRASGHAARSRSFVPPWRRQDPVRLHVPPVGGLVRHASGGQPLFSPPPPLARPDRPSTLPPTRYSVRRPVRLSMPARPPARPPAWPPEVGSLTAHAV